MTKYQRKRNFLAKINARIKTLANRAGVDIKDITSSLDEIDGVWITNAGNLNMDTNYFNETIVAEIEELIPTYMSEADRAKTEILESWQKAKNFIGPRPEKPSEKQINRNIRANFRFDRLFNEEKEKFYEWADRQNEVTIKYNQNYNDLKDALSEFGKRWNSGDLTAQDRLDQLEDLNAMGFNDLAKLMDPGV